MGSKQLKTDLNFAWPSAEIAVMGASGAVAVLQAKAIKTCKEEGGDVAALIAEKEQEIKKIKVEGENKDGSEIEICGSCGIGER